MPLQKLDISLFQRFFLPIFKLGMTCSGHGDCCQTKKSMKSNRAVWGGCENWVLKPTEPRPRQLL
jgi:hypothetical protein